MRLEAQDDRGRRWKTGKESRRFIRWGWDLRTAQFKRLSTLKLPKDEREFQQSHLLINGPSPVCVFCIWESKLTEVSEMVPCWNSLCCVSTLLLFLSYPNSLRRFNIWQFPQRKPQSRLYERPLANSEPWEHRAGGIGKSIKVIPVRGLCIQHLLQDQALRYGVQHISFWFSI